MQLNIVSQYYDITINFFTIEVPTLNNLFTSTKKNHNHQNSWNQFIKTHYHSTECIAQGTQTPFYFIIFFLLRTLGVLIIFFYILSTVLFFQCFPCIKTFSDFKKTKKK